MNCKQQKSNNNNKKRKQVNNVLESTKKVGKIQYDVWSGIMNISINMGQTFSI